MRIGHLPDSHGVCTHSKEWEFAKLKKKRPRRCRDPVIVKAQWAISDQRHQLKRQTSDEVKRYSVLQYQTTLTLEFKY
jgi:hypothetical protein